MIEIIKWSETFENADTRKRQRLGIYGPPSGCDSRGYMKLMRDGTAGALAFGVFTAFCQLMATMSKEIRAGGVFKNSDGSLMDLSDILDKTRLSGMTPADFQQACGRLVACKWVKLHKSLDSQNNAGFVPGSCQSPPDFVQGEGEGEGEGEDSRATDQYTGAEIEAVFVEALHEAFGAGRDVTEKDVFAAIGDIIPMATLMDGEIGRLRHWAKGRAREAASKVNPTRRGARRMQDN